LHVGASLGGSDLEPGIVSSQCWEEHGSSEVIQLPLIRLEIECVLLILCVEVYKVIEPLQATLLHVIGFLYPIFYFFFQIFLHSEILAMKICIGSCKSSFINMNKCFKCFIV